MTEENERDLLKRAETALSGMALPEPNWDGLASRIEGAVATPPTENAALFDAPLPRSDDDGSRESEAPPSVEPAVDSGMVRAAPPTLAPAAATEPTALAALDATLSTADSKDPGPAISISPMTEEFDDEWSGLDAADERAPAVASAAPRTGSVPPPGEAGRERVSLADLARATVARRGSSETASIAKESLAVASQSRAQDAEVAQRVKAASLPPPAPKSMAPPAPSARAAAPATSARAAAPAPTRSGGDVLKGPWIGVTIAGIGLAAAFALVLSRPDNPPVTIVQQAPVQPAVPQAEAPLPQAPALNPAPPAAEPAPAAEAALDPTSLPKLPLEQAPRTEPKSDGAAAKAPAAKATPGSPGKVAAEKIVLDEDQKAAPKTAPSAPRPDDGKLRPADSTDKMTDRPSAGAAQAAVGAVLGAARACVAGHPQPSSAQLVFGSDGQVQSVAVGGPAAGTAAAGCIEGALKKARVQPFAASSFSLGVTVRPP